MKSNFEKITRKGVFEITTGYDSDIRFFFRITMLHGLETAFFNRLFAIRINTTQKVESVPNMQRRQGWF